MRAAAIGLVFLSAGLAPAQIVLKPAGGQAADLKPKALTVTSAIRKQVASTTWDYTFANEGRFRGEADFLVAIPEGGVVTGFAYWYEGEKVVARVAEKERARDIYKAITTRQRDPALVELVGKRTFRAKIFPVQAGADLRVEVTMVQALPSTPAGPRLVLPLKALGRVESLKVRVWGASGLMASAGSVSGGEASLDAANSTVPDLRVTQGRPPRALQCELLAARSGGPVGFFALTLTASRAVAAPRLTFAGVKVSDVVGLPERMVPGKAYTVVGRYQSATPAARLFLAGRGFRTVETLDFPKEADPNGPATKLWAWAKIGASRDRKEIVALSVRHTVPSAYTSWIAIPAAERARFAREIAMGDLRRFGRGVARTITTTGVDSAASKRAIAAYETKARSLGIDPRQTEIPGLYEYAEALGARWAKEADRNGERSPRAQRIERQLARLRQFGVAGGDAMYRYHSDRARALAKSVYEDRLAGRDDAAARRRAREFARHAKAMGSGVEANLLSSFGYREARRRADAIAVAERAGTPVPQADHDDLARRARAIGREKESVLQDARDELVGRAVTALNSQIERELRASAPDIERLETLRAERAKEASKARYRYEDNTEMWVLTTRYRQAIEALAAGRIGTEEAKAERDLIGKYFRLFDLKSVSLENTFGSSVASRKTELVRLQLQARRDRAKIAAAQAVLDRLSVLGDIAKVPDYGGSWGPNPELRDPYVLARHAGEPADEKLETLRRADAELAWKRKGYAETRAQTLLTLTALDALDGITERPLTAEESRTKVELEARAKVLHARMGDPIVSIDAPETARGLVAIMPDGERLAMSWNRRRARWEARFDIPAGTPDGPFTVRVEGRTAEGAPLVARAEFLVDGKAPALLLTREGEKVVATTEEDVARVALFPADGTRRAMLRERPGRFVLTSVPEGDLRAVATDRAHNRSDAPASSLVAGAPAKVDARLNVQALALYGDRLWISTLDAGGRFEGGEAVPEVGPWPRQAVAYGDRLAVRTAPGDVLAFDGRTWATLARDATAVAGDGETLLVATVGGWTEIGPSGKRTLRPKALAGLPITCLLAKGTKLWIGTQGRGLYEYDRATGTGVWHDERRGLTDDWITALGVDGAGRVVAGTFTGGALTLGKGTLGKGTLGKGAWSLVPGTGGACVTAVLGDAVATRRGVIADGKVVTPGEAQALAPGRVGLRGGIVPREPGRG